MKPQKTNRTDYERVPKHDEWIDGKITKIEYESEHKSTFQGEGKIRPAVRFVFALDGCKFPHRTKWLTFSYGDKSTLYKTFIANLVLNAEPDMDLDLDALLDMEIKTMWTQNEEYDNLTMVRAKNNKVDASKFVAAKQEEMESAEVGQ